MASVIHVHQYLVRYHVEREGVVTMYEKRCAATSARSAILKACREHALEMFGPDRRGRVTCVVRHP